jgi:two-component system sensor histidine kinase UhpB
MAQSVQDSIEARRQAREATQALAENRELTQTIQARIELERAAISRELHDELGQQVTAIKSVGLAIARRAAGSDATTEQSARLVMQCADQIYDGMHRMIAKLRPLALDQFGLFDALRDLLSDCQMQHPELVISATLPDAAEAAETANGLNANAVPSDALATAVYRIVQEALTNVLRHAQATRLDLNVTLAAGTLQLVLRDNGRGRISEFPSHGHYGLSGMRERVQALGGSFALLQCEPSGVEIRVQLPFTEQASKQATDVQD